MINSNYKRNEEENIPFGIHPSKDHSHSLAPYAPAFLAGTTGRRRIVPKKEVHQPLYSPPLGHPLRPRPPSGIHRALRRATPGLRRALVPLRRAPVHPPLGTRPSVRLPCSSIGYRGPLRWATPSGFSVGPLRLAHRPTVCINILAYHDYVYMEIHMARNTKYLTMALTHK
jgi:hypothetical protein